MLGESSIHPSEAFVRQRVSEGMVRDLVGRYSQLIGQCRHEGRRGFSKEKGVLEGRYSALGNILDRLGQRDVIRRLDGQSPEGGLSDIDIAPITQPDMATEQELLEDYRHLYMQRLLSANRRPNISIANRILGKAGKINSYYDYALGINEGRLEEIRGFLQKIELGVQTDSIQQQAEHMLHRDPHGMQQQVGEGLRKKMQASLCRLREATKALDED